jgi:hypothetical protein
MKQSPEEKKLEELMRGSKLVAGGFLGDDHRRVSEIIEADRAELERLGAECEEVADKMRAVTEKAVAGLGNWVDIKEGFRAKVDEAKGALICPWPHAGRFAKRVTTLENEQTGEILRWSDLNIHLIGEHGFFEGKGTSYRIEPGELVSWLY